MSLLMDDVDDDDDDEDDDKLDKAVSRREMITELILRICGLSH